MKAKDAQLAIRTRIEPALTFTLSVGALNERQVDKLHSAYVGPVVRAMGFNSCTPRAVVFAPVEVGGLGCKHLFAEQGALKIQLLMQQIRAGSAAGKAAVIWAQWVQRVAGVSWSVFEDVKTRLPQLKDEEYLVTLRRFLRLSDLGMQLPSLVLVQPKRIGDKAIMDIALEYSKDEISDTLVERINRCREWLRAETIADIASADGKTLCQAATMCLEGARVQSSELWPKQPHIGAVHKRAWQWFLKKLCKDGSKCWELRQPLGDWTVKPIDKGWPAYYDVNSDVMWLNMDGDGRWTEVSIDKKARKKWELGVVGQCIENEEFRAIDELIPVDIWPSEVGYFETSVPARWVRQQGKMAARGWEEWVERLPEAERDLLQGCREVFTNGNDRPLWDILQDERCELVTVSDGSHQGKRGSFGWVMAADDQIVWECRGRARGNPMTSYRAEAYGKVAWLVFLCEFAKCFKLDIKCKVRSYCDNLEVVKQTNFGARQERAW
jgi:hypothetical protein